MFLRRDLQRTNSLNPRSRSKPLLVCLFGPGFRIAFFEDDIAIPVVHAEQIGRIIPPPQPPSCLLGRVRLSLDHVVAFLHDSMSVECTGGM
jgi:hypothetical protein